MPNTAGLHHVTAIASRGPANVQFYTELLGMRMVKKTVNFDVPDTWHLYYGDESGSPGSAMTFFLWPDLPPAREGNGVTRITRFAVPPGSLSDWETRLTGNGTPFETVTRFGETQLHFQDPDGMRVALVERGLDTGPVGTPGIYGFDGVELQVADAAPTAELLESMGYTKDQSEGSRIRYRSAGKPGDTGQFVELDVRPDAPGSRQGIGAVHHIAFRAADEAAQSEFRHLADKAGLNPSPVMDRSYFRSIYFREPNGILFEVATNGPGFTVDEPLETLGQSVKLPPQLESARSLIESRLPPLRNETK